MRQGATDDESLRQPGAGHLPLELALELRPFVEVAANQVGHAGERLGRVGALRLEEQGLALGGLERENSRHALGVGPLSFVAYPQPELGGEGLRQLRQLHRRSRVQAGGIADERFSGKHAIGAHRKYSSAVARTF